MGELDRTLSLLDWTGRVWKATYVLRAPARPDCRHLCRFMLRGQSHLFTYLISGFQPAAIASDARGNLYLSGQVVTDPASGATTAAVATTAPGVSRGSGAGVGVSPATASHATAPATIKTARPPARGFEGKVASDRHV